MRTLAIEIAQSGRVFDMPMVVSHQDSFIIKDGNRRVTCVKLIHDPSLAPPKFKGLFDTLNEQCATQLSKQLTCQIETPEIADKIVGLRHNGKQDGAGQVMFGPREKAIHANRISGKSDYSMAQLVENYLIVRGFEAEAKTIKRSTLEKILDTKKRKLRLGLSEGKDGKLKSASTEEKTLRLLLKLVDDMKTGGLTLKDLLTSQDKENYIDILQSKGFLPEKPKPGSPDGSNFSPAGGNNPRAPSGGGSPSPDGGNPRPPQPSVRYTLIPRQMNYHSNWSSGQNKIMVAWEELQYRLNLKDHKFAIAVLFRVMLDMVALNFMQKQTSSQKIGYQETSKWSPQN